MVGGKRGSSELVNLGIRGDEGDQRKGEVEESKREEERRRNFYRGVKERGGKREDAN